MLKRIPFGALEPDRPQSLFRARNCWPTSDGYMPARDFDAITTSQAGLLNAGAFVASDGSGNLLAGSATNLYKYSGSAWVSQIGSLTATDWRFDQFGDLVIAVNGAGPIKYDMSSGTAAALGGSPPLSSMVATVREQVFLAGNPSDRTTLAISGYNNSEGWTAGTNQCLYVPFPDGGDIMGLAGGETGIILQQRAVRRATYTGDVTVWQFDKISQNIGCMAQGSVASAGQMVFFLSEQGFMATDRNTVIPIGSEKVDRTFFATYTRSDIANISCAVDPRATVVCWLMPGNPGRMWCYNWTLQRWGDIEVACSRVFTGFTASISLEALDALFPDGLESMTESLDSSKWAGGNPLMLLISNDNYVGALTGDITPAKFELAPQEFQQGSRVRVRRARVLSDAIDGTVTVDARARAGDASANVVSGDIRGNGSVAVRANGNFIGLTVDIPSTQWNYALGVEIEYEVGGTR